MGVYKYHNVLDESHVFYLYFTIQFQEGGQHDNILSNHLYHCGVYYYYTEYTSDPRGNNIS